MADEFELLAAVTMVEPCPVVEENDDPRVVAQAQRRLPAALDPPARDIPESGTVMAGNGVPQHWSRQFAIVEMSELAGVRHELHELLGAADVDTSVVEDIALAVEEVASNGIRHGKPPVQVRVSQSRERVDCAVIDQGPGFDWASVTDRVPETLAEGQFGLRLAQELCDELTTFSGSEGFVVRMVKRL
jgi:anti-sigma regulatory factor (Ser/Thr protein kinase)